MRRECQVLAKQDGDRGTQHWLLEPKTIGGFCIYIPAWEAQGARDVEGVKLQANCHGRREWQPGAAILFLQGPEG